MSKPTVVVFDIDGVLADFGQGFHDLRCKIEGKPLEPGFMNQTWDELMPDASPLNRKVWDLIGSTDGYWINLSPMVTPTERERISRMLTNQQFCVYFATNRTIGPTVLYQTKYWLNKVFACPTNLIMTKLKGEFCKCVAAHFAIDDKADNANAIAWLSKETTPCLLDRPYNQYDHKIVGSHRVQRIQSLSTFLMMCGG